MPPAYRRQTRTADGEVVSALQGITRTANLYGIYCQTLQNMILNNPVDNETNATDLQAMRKRLLSFEALFLLLLFWRETSCHITDKSLEEAGLARILTKSLTQAQLGVVLRKFEGEPITETSPGRHKQRAARFIQAFETFGLIRRLDGQNGQTKPYEATDLLHEFMTELGGDLATDISTLILGEEYDADFSREL